MNQAIARNPTSEWTPVDMLAYLSSTTLDIIGLAGFHYPFNSVQHLAEDKRDDNELSAAFSLIFSVMSRHRIIGFLKTWFPIFRIVRFDERSRIESKSNKTIYNLSLIHI